jgi:hypothetical protein
MDNGIDPKFFNQVAQIAHTSTTFGISYLVTTKFGWWGFLASAVGVVAYAAWHEFIHDPEAENAATRGSDLQDFCFLCLGPVIAALMYWL